MSNQSNFVKAVKSKKASQGWIASDGHILYVGMYNHLAGAYDYIKSKKKFSDLEIIFDGFQEEINKSHDSHQRHAEIEGDCHAEWHSHEILCDSILWKKTLAVIKAGWVRILFDRSNATIRIHGSPEGIKEHYERIESLKRTLEYELFETCPVITIDVEREIV